MLTLTPNGFPPFPRHPSIIIVQNTPLDRFYFYPAMPVISFPYRNLIGISFSLWRFVLGIFLGIGFLLTTCIHHVDMHHHYVYCTTITGEGDEEGKES